MRSGVLLLAYWRTPVKVKSYEDLIVWQLAMKLANAIYSTTAAFPRSENYGLTIQIRRAAVSVPSNIAEGQGRLTRGEFRQFLGTARGSLFELQTQIRIAESMGYLDKEISTALLRDSSEVGRVLNGLLASLQPERAEPVVQQN
jgi:four helix bundle protein